MGRPRRARATSRVLLAAASLVACGRETPSARAAPAAVPSAPDVEEAPTPVEPAIDPAAGLPATAAPLLLLATVVAGDASAATILDREHNTVVAHGPGDEPRPGLAVASIARDRVILRRGEQREVLSFMSPGPVELTRGPTPGARRELLARDLRSLLVEVPAGGLSVGLPHEGRLVGGVQLPQNPALYTRRVPGLAWGSSFALARLQEGVARFRRRGFDIELGIGSISKQHGGRFPPHKSHQSGRDVDISVPRRHGLHDWDATWALVKALIDTGAVERIFLDHGRQRRLYEAARRDAIPVRTLERYIQYPRGRAAPAVVQHQRGHAEHLHVRFRCGPTEPRCEG